MRLIRKFCVFVIVSLVVGLGSAFNGQNFNNSEELKDNQSTKVVENEISNDNIVEQEDIDTENNNTEKSEKSFSASNQETVKDTTKDNSQKKQKEKSSTNITENKSITQQETKTNTNTNTTNDQQQVVQEKETTNNNVQNDNVSNSDDESNKFYYSITKGRAEYSIQSECYSAGLAIQNKELDAILDWNEANPDNQKQPVIKSSMCIGVMKNGKEHYFLHFVTTTGNNLDDELKSQYK